MVTAGPWRSTAKVTLTGGLAGWPYPSVAAAAMGRARGRGGSSAAPPSGADSVAAASVALTTGVTARLYSVPETIGRPRSVIVTPGVVVLTLRWYATGVVLPASSARIRFNVFSPSLSGALAKVNVVPETVAPIDVPSIVTDFRSASRTVPVTLCGSDATFAPSAGLIETST